MSRNGRYTRLLLIVAGVLLLLSGCVAEQSADVAIIEKGVLGPERVAEMEYENSDTLSFRDIEVFVVCDRNLVRRHHRLPLVVECIAPDSTSERFEWTLLTNTAGERTTATQTELKQTFVKNARLKQRGRYKFNISLDSSTTVRGIRAIGVEVSTKQNGER